MFPSTLDNFLLHFGTDMDKCCYRFSDLGRDSVFSGNDGDTRFAIVKVPGRRHRPLGHSIGEILQIRQIWEIRQIGKKGNWGK